MLWLAIGPEVAVYFLLGVATFAFGSVALARWAVESWRDGSVIGALAPVFALVVVPIAAVILVRRERRVLAIGAAMAWVGFVAFALSMLGFSLPASWFG